LSLKSLLIEIYVTFCICENTVQRLMCIVTFWNVKPTYSNWIHLNKVFLHISLVMSVLFLSSHIKISVTFSTILKNDEKRQFFIYERHSKAHVSHNMPSYAHSLRSMCLHLIHFHCDIVTFLTSLISLNFDIQIQILWI
jgi:hypothetical protein